MRPTLAALVLTGTALAAPVPLPRPVIPADLQPQFQAAESNEAAASRLNLKLITNQLRDPKAREVGWNEVHRLYRRAAEQYYQVAEALSKRGRGMMTRKGLALASVKAGRAWVSAGEPARALVQFERAIREAHDPRTRVEALGAAMACHAELKQVKEMSAKRKLLRKELPRLPEEERKKWEAWLIVVDSIVQ